MEGTAEVKASTEQAKLAMENGGVVVLDFGGQYTQLIARRVREQQVFSAILPCTTPLGDIRKLEPAGIILSGGPSSVYDKDAPKCDPAVLAMGIPILGICYGMQWVAKNLGGRVEPAERREYGPAQLNVHKVDSQLFRNFPDTLKIWNSHGDNVHELPPGFHATGRTSNAIAAAEDPKRKIYTVQFHPEVNHTDRGTEILRNFLFTVCKAEPKWSGTAFIQETVEAIRTKVGTQHAVCGLSGGVDSTVAAVLVHRAMGDKLTNIFVNTGMLRKNEFEHTLEMYRDRLGLRVVGVDASDHFLNKLKGVSDPETKRKIIGASSSPSSPQKRKGCRRTKPTAISNSSCKAPSTRMSLNRCPLRGHPLPSRRTTTLAGCLPICPLTSSSLCATSSKTKSGASARNWVYHKRYW
jgi:GMP synthase (glutamine-hydrolysing)